MLFNTELKLTKFDKTAESRRTLHTHTHTHTCNSLLSKCKNCVCNFYGIFFQKTKLIFATLVVAIFYAGAYATTDIQPNGNLAGGNTAADCTQPVLGTYSGSTNFEAKWRANEVPLRWYNEGERITTVQDAAKTCTYDGVLNLPSTAPSRTGYTFGGWKVITSLPAEYTELEYLQSSGTQYIDTGIKGNLNTKATIKFLMTESHASSYWFAIFGARESKTSKAFNLWAPITTGVLGANFSSLGAIESSVSYAVNTPYIAELSKSGLRINNNFAAITNPASFTTPGNIYLFSINGGSAYTSGNGNRVMIGRVYFFRLYDNGTLVRSFIPARRKSDSVLGMYDTVSGTFFTNIGSGTFTAGPDLN